MGAFRPTSRRKGLLGLVFVGLVAVSITAGATSLALFTDQESVDNTFSTGSVILDPVKIQALSLTTSGLMPGSSITGPVDVSNIGASQLRYALSTSSTNTDGKELRSQLTLTIKELDVTTPLTPCNDFDGASVLAATVLFDGVTNAGFGDPAAGADAGDRVLDAGTEETLCFRVTLPSGTTTTYQDAETVTTFTFDAEQTANNP